ncbi:hypothetical protein D3H65_03610 [Paraflavitalea soli]|uniref:Uncharacterized protein n=1 Tax=Paraflavitalea soli TaxID=2315862 RepID=A0A3B7MFK6_9BACT|nr:hypothetical protein [Paraflavitalea soli]AXY73112.1 hypothetical protein D3H65_03610 [Paraflavitalea soli]
MKPIFNFLFLMAGLSVLAAGCKKEKALTPSPEKENVYGDYTLPQGNHPYDADILQLFQKYNTMFLYKYVAKDLYYQVKYYTNGIYDPVKDSTTASGYFDVPANEAYVGQQLALLKDLWLKYYPDALMKAGLPKKIFLLDSFYYAYAGPGKPTDNWPTPQDTYQGPDFFALTWGGPRITSITAAERYAYKSTLNSVFLSTAFSKGAIKRSSAFTVLTNYTGLTYANFQQEGVIDWYRRSPDADWDAFMSTIVSNTYTQLTATGGVLNPAIDTKGIIKKKYDIVIAYFKATFGVDLQAIGNAQ